MSQSDEPKLKIIGGEVKKYRCPKGHEFETNDPGTSFVTADPNYTTGVTCCYCYVDFIKEVAGGCVEVLDDVNVNVGEEE